MALNQKIYLEADMQNKVEQQIIKDSMFKRFSEILGIHFAPFLVEKGQTQMRRFERIIGPHKLKSNGINKYHFSLLTQAFLKIYPIQGLEPELNTLNGEKLKKDQKTEGNLAEKSPGMTTYLAGSSWQFLIGSFLGLSTYLPTLSINDVLKMANQPSELALILLKNFIGWNSPRPIALKILASPFIVTWNLMKILPKLAWNILTLVTEFIPHAIEMLSLKAISTLVDVIQDKAEDRLYVKILAGLGVALLMPVYYASKLAAIFGRTITSPLASMKAGWAMGQHIAGEGIAGKILGGFFVALSFAITVTVYGVLLPLAIKAIIAHAPAAISSAVSSAINFLNTSPIVLKVGAALTKVFGPIVQPIASLVGHAFSVTVSPALTSLGIVIGSAIASVGNALKLCGEKIQTAWNKANVKSEKPAVELNEESEYQPHKNIRIIAEPAMVPSNAVSGLVGDLTNSGKKLTNSVNRTSHDHIQMQQRSQPIDIPKPQQPFPKRNQPKLPAKETTPLMSEDPNYITILTSKG